MFSDINIFDKDMPKLIPVSCLSKLYIGISIHHICYETCKINFSMTPSIPDIESFQAKVNDKCIK